MHFILGLLGTIVTVLVLLSRLADAGISLGGLNPFLWKRRKDWQSQHDANPIFNVDNPMEISALLLTAAAKIDGDISTEQKEFVLTVFRDEFHRSEKEAAGLLASSNYLLGDGQAIQHALPQVLKPSLAQFSEQQAKSTINILQRLCDLDTHPSELRLEFNEQVKKRLLEPFEPKEEWS